MNALRALRAAVVCGLVLPAWVPCASAQVWRPVSVDSATSQISVTYTLAGRTATVWVPFSGSFEAAWNTGPGGVPVPGTVQVRDLHARATPFVGLLVPFPPTGTTAVQITGFEAAQSGSASGTAADDPGSGGVSFSVDPLALTGVGTVVHTAMNVVCTQVQLAGAPCDLNASVSSMQIDSARLNGTIKPSAAGSDVTGQLRGGMWVGGPGATWGRLDFFVLIVGTAAPGGGCTADFNHSGAASVQDIFDFLAAWFAGNSAADVNGAGGVTVQDIFDFLAAWFAGC